jgi:hypothetical protein
MKQRLLLIVGLAVLATATVGGVVSAAPNVLGQGEAGVDINLPGGDKLPDVEGTLPACSNGKDDDGDGKLDYPADPGCTSTTDTDETDAPAPPPPPPTTTKTAAPSSLTLNTGSVRSGGVSSLGADDNAFFQVASTSGSVMWWGRMTAVPNTLANLQVTYRGLSSPACTQNLAIWNWRTGIWVSLGSRTAGTTEVETSLTPTGTLADYVRGTTGNGDVAVRFRCTGTTFTSSSDLLRVSYTG